MTFLASYPNTLGSSWGPILASEFEKPYMQKLITFLQHERAGSQPIYPAKQDVFRAFRETPFDQVKVVIVGQDPYHGPGQAQGMSFSVPPGIRIPPSLRNIFLELKNDLGMKEPTSGDLTGWARQGVLLLNATLTVRQGSPKSHYGQGWEVFTSQVIREIANRQKPCVFLLWGRSARDKVEEVLGEAPEGVHFLTAPHPSPFSAHSGFFGCQHFSKANQLLEKHGESPIFWENL